MTADEHLLVCSVEEAVEVAEEVSTLSRSFQKFCTKSLRFGLDERSLKDPTGPTNRERLVSELIDLFAVVEMMAEAGMIEPDWLDPERVRAKQDKVRKYMGHAVTCGALSEVKDDTERVSATRLREMYQALVKDNATLNRELEHERKAYQALAAHHNANCMCPDLY